MWRTLANTLFYSYLRPQNPKTPSEYFMIENKNQKMVEPIDSSAKAKSVTRYKSIHKSVLDEVKHVPHENIQIAECKLDSFRNLR